MSSLFEQLDNWKADSDANVLDRHINGLLRPIYDEYLAKGYNPREINYVINMANLELSLMHSLMIKEKKHDE